MRRDPKMEYAGFAFVIAIFILSAVVTLYKRKSRRYKGSLPVGTYGWPLIGETIQFISCAYSDHAHTFMDDRRRRYGKVFKSHLFGRRVIVSTDEEVNRRILQCEANTFVPFMPKSVVDLLGKSSILVINGSMQRRLHGLIAAFVKSPHLKAQFTLHFQNCIRESMATWKEDHPIHIQYEAGRITFRVLVKALISLDPGEEMEHLSVQLKAFIAGFVSLPIKLPGSRLYNALQAKKKMAKLVNKIIEGKRNSSRANSSVAVDLAEIFLKDESDKKLTDEMISDNIIDLMIPAEDSLPVLIALTVRYLSDCPLALQQFTEENMKLKRQKDEDGETLYWSDYLSLPFTQCVITETLRKANMTSGVMREAVKDVEINGYFIPKGWCVMADFRSVHLDHNLHHSPHQFNPWRWKGKDLSSMMGSSSFTPFGGGQRLCAGLDLARLQVSIFLHHFVTHFRWVAEEDSIISFPTVWMKKGMPVWVQRRIDL